MQDLLNSLEWKITELVNKYNEQKEIVSSLGQEIEKLKYENECLVLENDELKSRVDNVDTVKNDIQQRILTLVEKLDNIENN